MFSIGKTPAKSNKPRTAKATPAKRLKQTYLDFGQTKFDHITCSRCGMVYSPGVEDAEHMKYCKTKSADLRWVIGKETDVILDFDAKGAVLIAGKSDPRTKQLKQYVETDLGFCEPEGFQRNTTILVFVFKNRAVGFIETDPIISAERISSKSAKSAVSFGVLKIWVHPEARRKNIATMMLDAARAYHGYPAAVPKALVAFSSPTGLGRAFAERYFETEDFLVYQM